MEHEFSKLDGTDAAPVESVNMASSADGSTSPKQKKTNQITRQRLLQHLFELQMVVGHIGMDVATADPTDDLMQIVAQDLAALSTATRHFLARALHETAKASPSASVPPAPTQPAPAKEKTSRKRSHNYVSAALNTFPLFTKEKDLLEHLERQGITTRAQLANALVALGHKRTVVENYLSRFLRQDTIFNQMGLSKYGRAIVVDVAKMPLPEAPAKKAAKTAQPRVKPAAPKTARQARKNAKTLDRFPLFANGNYAVLHAALIKADITTHPKAVATLVEIAKQTENNVSAAAISTSLYKLLQQTTLTNSYRQLSPIAKKLVAAAGLQPVDVGVLTVDSPAPAPRPPRPPFDGGNNRRPPVFQPPVDPDKPEVLPFDGDETALFENMKAKFQPVAVELAKREIEDVDGMWNLIPADFRGKRSLFVERLHELVATEQPYNLENNNGNLKVLPGLLSRTLTPSSSSTVLWGECRVEQTRSTIREPNRRFATLMVQYSPNLLAGSKAVAGMGTNPTIYLQTVTEVGAILNRVLHGIPKDERALKITGYTRLFAAKDQVVIDKNLTPTAAEVMDIFRIPSREVASLFPQLQGNLLFTDMVRAHFPNLAGLMFENGQFTVPGVERKWAGVLSRENKANLTAVLGSDDAAALRAPEMKPLVSLLSDIYKATPDYILSPQAVPLSMASTAQKPAGGGQLGDAIVYAAPKF